MRNKHQILRIMLALLLIGSNMAFSAHISSHVATDTGLCSLCVHPGRPDVAITPEPGVFVLIPATFTLVQSGTTTPFAPIISHDHLSRAPPCLA